MREAERRGLILAFLVFGGFWGAWAAVLPAVRAQAHVSDGQLGLALGAIAVSAVPVMPLAGRLADRYGARRVLPATLVAFGLVLPLPSLAHGVGSLVPALVLLGFATGALDVVANTASAGWERLESGRLMTFVHGAFSSGVLVGSVSAGLARQAGTGPTPILLAVGVVVLAVAAGQPPYRRADTEHAPGTRAGLSWVLVGIGLLTAGAFLCEDAIQSWSALHLERGLGATPAVSGLGPGLFAAAMAAGRFGGGMLHVREDRLLAGAGLLVAVGALVVALAPNPSVALVGLVVAGAGTSVLAPVLYSAVGARAAPGRQGADLGLVSTLGYVGFVAGPPLVGAVSAAFSLPVALGSLAGVGGALAIGGAVLLRPSGKMAA
ncbi:MAG: MFS transporter [Mycobacteriales bacterium]